MYGVLSISIVVDVSLSCDGSCEQVRSGSYYVPSVSDLAGIPPGKMVELAYQGINTVADDWILRDTTIYEYL